MTECQNAIDWSNEILKKSLERVMFADEKRPTRKINKIQKLLGDQTISKAHARHITFQQAKEAGLRVMALEEDNVLQDLILSLHHLLCLTFEQTTSVKIFANNFGSAYVTHGVLAKK